MAGGGVIYIDAPLKVIDTHDAHFNILEPVKLFRNAKRKQTMKTRRLMLWQQ